MEFEGEINKIKSKINKEILPALKETLTLKSDISTLCETALEDLTTNPKVKNTLSGKVKRYQKLLEDILVKLK